MESGMFYTFVGDKMYPYLRIRDDQRHRRCWGSTKPPYQGSIRIIWKQQHTKCHHLHSFWETVNEFNKSQQKTFQGIPWHIDSALRADIRLLSIFVNVLLPAASERYHQQTNSPFAAFSLFFFKFCDSMKLGESLAA